MSMAQKRDWRYGDKTKLCSHLGKTKALLARVIDRRSLVEELISWWVLRMRNFKPDLGSKRQMVLV